MRKISFANILKLIPLGLGLPLIAGAQGQTIDGLIDKIRDSLNSILQLLFVLITIYFIWGVIVYVTAGGDDEKLAKGKKHMLWGIIGLAVVAAAWGLARLVIEYLGVPEGSGPSIPTI